VLTRNWWAFVLRGIVAILLGVMAFAVPGPTLVALIAVFAAYAIFDGVLAIVVGASSPFGPRWWIVVGGIAGVAIGLFTIFSPATTTVALVLLIGVWAIATGLGEVVSGLVLGRIADRLLLVASGVISVVLGAYLVVAPVRGVLVILWAIGFYAILAGVTYLAMGFRLRNQGHSLASTGNGSIAA
jgi:uncharacterized membrane protein HdeD (DUF308 family)